MFPIKPRKIVGFTFKQPYPAGWGSLTGKPHLGVDYSIGDGNIYAPFNGRIVWEGYGSEVGYVIHFKPDHLNVIIRFAHLKANFPVGQVWVSEGTVIGYGDNTGLSTAPHCHLDISKNQVNIYDINNFLDPETFNWSSDQGGSMIEANENIVHGIPSGKGLIWVKSIPANFTINQDLNGEIYQAGDEILLHIKNPEEFRWWFGTLKNKSEYKEVPALATAKKQISILEDALKETTDNLAEKDEEINRLKLELTKGLTWEKVFKFLKEKIIGIWNKY